MCIKVVLLLTLVPCICVALPLKDSNELKTNQTEHNSADIDLKHHSKMLSALQNILEDFHNRQEEYDDMPQNIEKLDSYLDSALSEFYDRYLEEKEDASEEDNGHKKIEEVKHEKHSNLNGLYAKIFEKHEKEEPMQQDMKPFQVENPQFVPLASLDQKNISAILSTFSAAQNSSKVSNFSYGTYARREGTLESTGSRRFKNFWIDNLKKTVLQGTGRSNDTSLKLSPEDKARYNLTALPYKFTGNPFGNTENGTQEQNGDSNEYVEKFRSFYPSCDVPRNTDEEMWKDSNTMNLFFGVDFGTTDDTASSINVASATLRLYRLPQNKSTTPHGEDCHRGKDTVTDEDDRQIRVSVYWYTRSLKKHKSTKRRLTDSRMVSLSSSQSYVEMNIRPAARSWTRGGRNLGLAIVVEDVDGLTLTASHYFRDVGCHTVGNVSTPKPVPSVVSDTIRNSKPGIALNNGDRTSYGYNNHVPILDICTQEPIPNITIPPEEGSEANTPCKNSNHGRTKSPAHHVKSLDEPTPKHNIRHRHHKDREAAKLALIRQFLLQHQIHPQQQSRDDR